MSGAWPDDIQHHLTIRVADPSGGPTQAKTIPRITQGDVANYRLLGAGAAQFLGHALNMAFNRVPDFYERVVAYRLVHDNIDEAFEEVFDRPYLTIEFYAAGDDDAPTSRPEPEYAFDELSLPTLFDWLEFCDDICEEFIESDPDPHIEVSVERHEYAWDVEIRLDECAGSNGESAGAIRLTIVAGSIYGVPPVIEFVESFNAQKLDTRVRWAWAAAKRDYRNMTHLTFELRHEMKPGDTITEEAFVELIGRVVDETYQGTLATEMRGIFSRAGEL